MEEDKNIGTPTEEWKRVKIRQIGNLMRGKGLSKEKINPDGRYKCILYGELFTHYKEKIKEVISKTDYPEGTISECGDVLIPGSTTTEGIDLAKASSLNEGGVYLGGDINIIRNYKKSFDSNFLGAY